MSDKTFLLGQDFLLEIGCEELPPFIQQTLPLALKEALQEQFLHHGVPPLTHIHTFSSPRRLAVFIKDLPSHVTVTHQKIGPAQATAFDAHHQPTSAAIGFAKSCGVSIDELGCHETEKGIYLLWKKTEEKNMADLLPHIVESAIAKLPVLKFMRWGNHSIKFARPVHWVVMLYENQLIQTTILGCQTAQTTQGHRIHHPEPILLAIAGSYVDSLKKAYVIADFEERKHIIQQQLAQQAALLNAVPVSSEDLLNEVTGLVEWPVVLTVPFEEKFLALPQEVLITAMQHHQKSFALTQDNKLIASFLVVANLESNDPMQVVMGNERVMKARLSDAEFFYHQDLTIPFENYREMTKHVILQAKLGSLYDKSERLIQLMGYLAPYAEINVIEAERAAFLSQCDLMTSMVGEFPELQGTMGYYYAYSRNEPISVARALDEQYWPRFSGDKLPTTPLGSLLAIADKVDTLVTAFSINQRPTGNKDPFKLRRHALGLIRILTHLDQDIPLVDLLSFAFQHSPQQKINSNTVAEVHTFILDRLKTYYLDEKGFSLPVIQAVLNQQSTHLHDVSLRIQAIQEFSTWKEAAALSGANKRVSHILSKENSTASILPALLKESAEKNLVDILQEKQKILPSLLEKKQYVFALKTLAELRQPVDNFFETVMVNVEDQALRHNRLAILTTLQTLFLSIADLSCLS